MAITWPLVTPRVLFCSGVLSITPISHRCMDRGDISYAAVPGLYALNGGHNNDRTRYRPTLTGSQDAGSRAGYLLHKKEPCLTHSAQIARAAGHQRRHKEHPTGPLRSVLSSSLSNNATTMTVDPHAPSKDVPSALADADGIHYASGPNALDDNETVAYPPSPSSYCSSLV